MKVQITSNGALDIQVQPRTVTEAGDQAVDPLVIEPDAADDYESLVSAAEITSDDQLVVSITNTGKSTLRVREQGENLVAGAMTIEPDDSVEVETLNIPAMLLIEELQPEIPNVHGGA